MRRYLSRSVLLLLALLLCVGPTAGASRSPAVFQPKPVKTFDLTVSLEWQPGTNDRLPDDLALAECPVAGADTYLEDLKSGLYQAAKYLYYYSEGQLALGQVTVYTGGDHWSEADLRVLASNDYRPAAFVGGIVGAPTPNISATAGMTRTVFYPATIFLGRAWDGRGGRCGGWSQPAGWRTIGHEWAHYALFLYDEYYNVDTSAEQYCTSTGLDLRAMPPEPAGVADSLMAYHYSADKLWLGGAPPPHAEPPPWSCDNTPQQRAQGETDWETIKRFYPAVVPPAAPRTDIVFEGSPAEQGFGVTVMNPAALPADTSAEVHLAALPAPRLVGQAYLIRPGPDGGPQRIIDQGEIVAGEKAALPFWGVQTTTKDRALVIVQNWATGERDCFPDHYNQAPALDVAASNVLSATTSQWRPGMKITPKVIAIGGISEVIGLEVRLKDCAAKTKRVQLAYCPAGGNCDALVAMNPPLAGSSEFTYTFYWRNGIAEPPALRGYIYARSLDTGEETAAWYQLGGGVGPAYGDGHAPLADSAVETSVASGQQLPAGDTRLLYSSAQGCDVAGSGLPSNILGFVGTPIFVQPVQASENGGLPWSVRLKHPPLQVRLSYSQDLLDRLGIAESQLVVLRLETLATTGQRVWQVVPTVAQSRTLDWIIAAPRPFVGEGAVYALGYVPARVWLPTIVR